METVTIPRWLFDAMLAYFTTKPMSLTCRKLATALQSVKNKGGA